MRRLSLWCLVLAPLLAFSCAQGNRLGRSGEYGPGAGDPGQDGEGENESDPGSPDPGHGGAGGAGGAGQAGGELGEGCAHDPCSAGPPLSQSCHPCVLDTCAQDDFCCTTEWDDSCVSLATTCNCDGGGPGVGGSDPGGEGGSGGSGGDPGGVGGSDPGGPLCAHAPCLPGEALDPSCHPCVAELCGEDPYCCEVLWDEYCVQAAFDVCLDDCF
jgi:hypothetical protein